MNESDRMKNEYKINGDITKIIIATRKRGTFETIISTEDLAKVLAEGNISVHLWDATPYARIYTKEKKIMSLHRFLMNAPSHLEVDHINHYGLDNRRENLRVCTRTENARNRRQRADYSHHPTRGTQFKKENTP
jgi:hypothetical protein